MLNGGKGIAWSQLAALAVLTGGLGWIFLEFRTSRGATVPYVSWVAAIVLLLVAVFVAAAGLPVRRFLRGEAKRPLDPIRAARTLALAQASAVTGAAVLGWYAAVLVQVLTSLELASSKDLVWPTIACAVAAAVVSGAGLLVQRWCRVQPPDEDSTPAAPA